MGTRRASLVIGGGSGPPIRKMDFTMAQETSMGVSDSAGGDPCDSGDLLVAKCYSYILPLHTKLA